MRSDVARMNMLTSLLRPSGKASINVLASVSGNNVCMHTDARLHIFIESACKADAQCNIIHSVQQHNTLVQRARHAVPDNKGRTAFPLVGLAPATEEKDA